MKIFLTKNVWWPFGSHMYHLIARLHLADLHQCDKFVYLKNEHPSYATFDGHIPSYFPNLNTPISQTIIDAIDARNDINPSHNENYIIDGEYTEKSAFKINSYHVFTKSNRIDTAFNFSNVKLQDLNINKYKNLFAPSESVNKLLNNITFTQQVDALNGGYIAAHVRWTDKIAGWCQEGVQHSPDLYFSYISNLCEKFNTRNLVLNCDNIDAVLAFQEANKKHNLNIIYDKDEILPENKWENSLFQRWALQGTHLKDNPSTDFELENDMINGFKIFRTFMNCRAMVGCTSSAMYKSPFILRNNENDIDLDYLDETFNQRQQRFIFKNPKTINDAIRLKGKKEIG